MRIRLSIKTMQQTKCSQMFKFAVGTIKIIYCYRFCRCCCCCRRRCRRRHHHIHRCIVANSNESEVTVNLQWLCLSSFSYSWAKNKMEWNECNVLKVNCLENVKCLKIKAAEKGNAAISSMHLSFVAIFMYCKISNSF